MSAQTEKAEHTPGPRSGIAVLARALGSTQWQLVSPRYATRSMSHARRIADMYVREWGWEAAIAHDDRPIVPYRGKP